MYAQHKNMRDVCMEILDQYDEGDSHCMTVLWWNIANGDPFPMAKGSRLAIEKLSLPKTGFSTDWTVQKELFKYKVKGQK